MLSYSSGHIDSIVQHGEKRWRFTGFYGHPEANNRHFYWTLLRRLSCMHDLGKLPWIVGGDFNEICFDTEKHGDNPRPLGQTREFRDVLDVSNLQDLHAEGEFFTWINRHAYPNVIFERIDRYVATFEWRILYPAARVHNLEFYHSNHRPIFLEVGGSQLFQAQIPACMRFEPHWATEADCSDVIMRGWNKQNTSLSLPSRLAKCLEILRTWAGDRFRKFPIQIRNKRMQLNALRTHDQGTLAGDRIGQLERDVEMLVTKDELYWKQRSRANWLAHGDRNSKYLHACASTHRAKNHIRGLVSSHGDWCTDTASMAEIVQNYFSDLFSSSNPSEEDR
ncbi:uncharacterized protein LOC142519745 [Primulina tabacum]|uniref:uncharacterized protein LOC142519745 n=1 Tax=Primulina tabacum TaxID=48773 RepID=UPI003F5916BC